ncbi:hypothetical protein GCM10027168_03790 [Streptomyces capparidis]
MQRIAEALARALAVAVVPVLVVGCSGSSDSGGSGSSGDADNAASASTAPPSPSASSPSPEPARFTKLPDPCEALSADTVEDLVPEVKDASGDAAKTSDRNARGGCSWNGLDGFQYRWLDVAYQRSDTSPGAGSAEDRAEKAYQKLKAASAAPDGLAKGEDPAIRQANLGDESQLVSAEVTKDGEGYRDVTVVVRTSNVVLTVSYDGAGFEGEEEPSAKKMEDGALRAAKEALAKVK